MSGQDNELKPEKNLSPAFARYQIARDKNGKPVDFTFLDVNYDFEMICGLPRNEILGEKASTVLPSMEKDGFDWNSIYNQLVSTGRIHTGEFYSKPLERWFKIESCDDVRRNS